MSFSFEGLEVYQAARVLVRDVYIAYSRNSLNQRLMYLVTR